MFREFPSHPGDGFLSSDRLPGYQFPPGVYRYVLFGMSPTANKPYTDSNTVCSTGRGEERAADTKLSRNFHARGMPAVFVSTVIQRRILRGARSSWSTASTMRTDGRYTWRRFTCVHCYYYIFRVMTLIRLNYPPLTRRLFKQWKRGPAKIINVLTKTIFFFILHSNIINTADSRWGKTEAFETSYCWRKVLTIFGVNFFQKKIVLRGKKNEARMDKNKYVTRTRHKEKYIGNVLKNPKEAGKKNIETWACIKGILLDITSYKNFIKPLCIEEIWQNRLLLNQTSNLQKKNLKHGNTYRN